MSELKDICVKKLALDLRNFRTIPQTDEIKAISSMISISPGYFWGLTQSLLDDGYIPTENIIVLKDKNGKNTVREGNRRVAALKLIHGFIPTHHFDIPEDIVEAIDKVPSEWKETNKQIPCAVYELKEKDTVDKIITRVHGKGSKASRENWKAIARARHNRDEIGKAEPALDLFEKYLNRATNITDDQRQRWSGDYAITVLDEAIKKAAKRFGANSASDLAKKYPSIKYRTKLDQLMHDIGIDELRFKDIRSDKDFLVPYGIPPEPSTSKEKSDTEKEEDNSSSSSSSQGDKGKKTNAVPLDDPRAVKRALRSFTPRGPNREKVVTLKVEAYRLDIRKTPFAFCFILRSLFEISAKLYCKEHSKQGGPSLKNKNGKDKTLKELLKDVAKHLISNSGNEDFRKELYGAQVALSETAGILSVTSMNQLVHNPSYNISPKDLCLYFANVFPLLRAMNE